MNKDYALEFIEALPLKEHYPALEGPESTGAPQVSFTKDNQAVAIGSQIAEFAAGVPQEFRAAIANSILLAQLAADKAVPNTDGSSAVWREAYRNVLFNTGWLFEGSSVSMQKVSQSGLEVSKAIIPVLAAILGPAVAAAALVTTILNGLAQMDKDSPWITLFHQEARRASANQFQISYVQAPEGKAPRMTLIFFELDASAQVTQVLFFKFSSSSATLLHSHTDLSANTAVLKAIEPALEKKVADRAATFINNIDISG